jgi:hypothetical protein
MLPTIIFSIFAVILPQAIHLTKSRILKYLIPYLFALCCYTSVQAQKKTFVTVKAGNNVMDVVPRSDIFFYPQFTSGKVFLRGGQVSEAKLNYTHLVDEIHFIDKKGDTLALDGETNIKFIAVGNDTFYYDEGYVRILSPGNSVKLAIRQVWIISETRQLGAYGSTNNSASMTSFKTMHEGGRLYDLVVNEDIILKKETKYYFGDKYNQFVIASKTNLLLLFPKEEQLIGKYLKENRISFNNKEDLEKTVQFVEQISVK